MSQNRSGNEGTTGNTGLGATGTPGTTGTHGTPGQGSTGQGTTGQGTYGGTQSTGGGTGTATALSQTAQDYGQRLSEVATHAKDYVSDKVSVVGDKIKDLQNADLGELAENAKEYARRKPGQALLISAGVGLLLGMILRGRR
ncbi:MAG TPA: DUF883 C-terminal domain-containing protein [Pyrinomonadaceae bacterium]|nr:DUF883 C-terminal domain-containing protein [Pyrinomonadaceae bacterium]